MKWFDGFFGFLEIALHYKIKRMKKLIKYTSLLLLIGTCTELIAQADLITTYQQVIDDFLHKKEITYKANYLFYDSLAATQATQQSTIRTWVTQKQIYSTFEDLEIIQQNEQYILVDHQTKIIQWQQDVEAQMPRLDLNGFTNLIETYQLTGQKFLSPKGYNGIRFSAAAPSKMKIEVAYDASSGLIYRLAVHFDFLAEKDMPPNLDQQKN